MSYLWLQPTLERISDLLKMPDRWNSYGGCRVSPRAAFEAVRFLVKQLLDIDPMPIIMPMPDGGLSLEWPLQLGSCRVIFQADGSVDASNPKDHVYGELACGGMLAQALSQKADPIKAA